MSIRNTNSPPTTPPIVPPDVTLEEPKLQAAKYTTAGIQRFEHTIKTLTNQLFSKSIFLAEAEKMEGYDREVTEKHVRQASIEMNKSIDKKKQPNWVVPVQAAEYLCTGIAGGGASHLDNSWGIFAFGAGLAVGVTLFIYRTTNQKK